MGSQVSNPLTWAGNRAGLREEELPEAVVAAEMGFEGCIGVCQVAERTRAFPVVETA